MKITTLNTDFKVKIANAFGLDPSNVFELSIHLKEDGRMYLETKQFITWDNIRDIGTLISERSFNVTGIK